MASATVEFVKLHSLTSDVGRELNGTTGKLGAWKIGNGRYEVFVGTHSYMIKCQNLSAVDPRWVAEVRRAPMRKRMNDMMSKFDAPGLHPCSISELQVLPKRFGGPGTNRKLLQSWWGDKVFRYIRERMETQRFHKGQPNWDMDRAIRQGTLMLAGVRSDGGHHMQEQPQSSVGTHIMVWPTIVFPRTTGSYWSYCQGLALMDNASAWVACSDALEIYGPYQTIVDVHNMPSTVHIEELDSDSEWTSLSNSF